MNLQELINITDELFYNKSNSYRVIESKQKELLSILKPTLNITKIDYKAINKYIETLKQNNNSNSTINSKTAYLSKILKYAYANNLIQNKPYIPYFKVKTKDEKYITRSEAAKMLTWCRVNKQTELQHIILIGLYTGLRINNILSLENKNIKLDLKCLAIYDKKTNRNFTLPISNKIKYILKNFKPFTMNYQQVYYTFNQMKQQLQLDDLITIHTLRHTFCSNLIQKGVPITTIQKLANHTNIKTTMRYSHLSINELEAAIDML